MIISKKTKYGLLAMFYLAKEYQRGPVLIGHLAEAENIQHKFLENILLILKNRGLLVSKKGRGGGYVLSRPPEEIMIGQVIRFLEGPIAPVTCVSQSAYRPCQECLSEQNCGVHLIMKEVRDAMTNILDKTSLVAVNRRIAEAAQRYNSNYTI